MNGNASIYGIKPHESGTIQLHQLGTKGVSADGRIFRYAQNGGVALVAGQLCIAADITTNHEDLAVNTAAVGDKALDVTLGAAAIAGNEYDEGILVVVDDTGQGSTYPIVSAPASAGSEAISVKLGFPIHTAFAAATTVTLVRNKWRDIVVSDGTQTDIPTGVPVIAHAISAFGWVQTGGFCSVLVDSNDTTVGTPVTIGAAVNGAVETLNAAGEPLVGYQPAGVGADAGEYGPFYLAMDT